LNNIQIIFCYSQNHRNTPQQLLHASYSSIKITGHQ